MLCWFSIITKINLFEIIAGKIKREKKIQEISSSSINLSVENPNKIKSSQARDDADPGVISDDDDFAVNITIFISFNYWCSSKQNVYAFLLLQLEDLSHKGSACSLDTSGQSDRKAINGSPISGLTVNLHGSVESVGNNDTYSKSPTMNRSPVAQPQDEWQRKLYKNKGIRLDLELIKLNI